jgi:uncharacterized protein YkwD
MRKFALHPVAGISFLLAAAIFLSSFSPYAGAQSQLLPRNDTERELFDLLNHERATQNLSALKWDDALFKAARQHALLMLNLNSLEHQLPGEPALEERLTAAGAHFAYIAENVAIGSNAQTIHSGWMNSPGHRKNILSPRITAVGIAAVSGNGGLFAVEDFSHAFPDLSREQQEKQVEALLVKQGFQVNARPVDARKACNGAPKMNFLTSFSMVKFEVPDLSEFLPEVEKKIRAQSFRNVSVGACETSEAAGFSGYRIVLLFY